MNLILSVVRTKILAIVLGTLGFGILSQFYNISGLLFAIIPIGTMGLLKYFSEFASKDEYGKISYLLKYFALLNTPFVLLISSLLLIFPNDFSSFLFSDTSYRNCFIFYAFAVTLGMLASLTDTYFRGLRNVKLYVIYSVINSVSGFVIFITLILLYDYIGAIISISLSCLIGISLGYFFLRKENKTFKGVKTVRVNSEIVKDILKLGLAMMILVAIQQITFLYIRATIASNLGLHEVGIFQSVYGISNNYFMLFLGVLGTYSIPLISTHKNSNETVIEINRTLRLLLLVYTPLVTFFFVFRFVFIKVFYTSAFLQAGDLLFFQLLGDFTKAISWVFGLWLIPYLKISLLMIFEIINNLIFALFFSYLLKYSSMGVESVSLAYLVAFIVHLVLNLIYLRIGLDFKFMNRNALSLTISVSCILLVFGASRFNVEAGYIFFAVIIIVWGILLVRKNDILQIKEMFYKFVKKS